jgi:hypothetical protein
MPLPTAPIDICNMALDLCGEAPIKSITAPVSDTEFLLSRHYDATRQATLRITNWHFAKTGALIPNVGSTAVTPPTGTPPAPSNATTTYDYTDAYALPSDFIRLLSVEGQDERCQDFHYDVRSGGTLGGKILCYNSGFLGNPTGSLVATINIRYIQDIQDVTVWDASFRDLMVMDLAITVCFQITKNKDTVMSLMERRQPLLANALAINGQERRPIRIERSKTLSARRRQGIDWYPGFGEGVVSFPTPSQPPSGTVTQVTVVSETSSFVFTGNPPAPGEAVINITMSPVGLSGSLLFFSAANTLGNLAPGTPGQLLATTVGGGLGWVGGSGTGTVNSVGLSLPGASSLFTITNSPVTGAGVLTATVTCVAGDLVYGSAANTFGRLAATTNGFGLILAAGLPSWASTVNSITVPSDETATNTAGAVAITRNNQNAVNLLGGPASPTASAATPSYKQFDKTAMMGGASGLRALPTSGALTGDYYNSAAWTQTGALTSQGCRIFNSGTLSFNTGWTVGTEMVGGFAGNGDAGTFTTPGQLGLGIGGGMGAFGNTLANSGGGGGGFGGAGGNAGLNAADAIIAFGGRIYPIYAGGMIPLGSGGGGGCGQAGGAGNGGAGGAGGGGVYIESTGNITFASGTAMTLTGGTGGTGATSTGSGGGGSGGGLQIRCLGTVTIASGASITAAGGPGGPAPTTGSAGGGGGGGYIDISGSTVTNSGTCTAAGGAAGTGGTVAAAAGAAGIVTLNQFVQGPRS